MKKFISGLFFVLFIFSGATFAFAQTVNSYPTASPAVACPQLTYNLYRGVSDYYTGGQVTQLQQFLLLRYGNQRITGYFGAMTAANVAAFQREQSVYPITGGVGPLTRAAIAQVCGGTQNTSYNFSASPNVGQAPLPVTFTMSTFITNTNGSYVVEFGDGQHDIMTKGSCIGIAAIQGGQGGIHCSYSVPHTYTQPGTYSATLSPYISCLYSNPRCMIAVQNLGVATVIVR